MKPEIQLLLDIIYSKSVTILQKSSQITDEMADRLATKEVEGIRELLEDLYGETKDDLYAGISPIWQGLKER